MLFRSSLFKRFLVVASQAAPVRLPLSPQVLSSDSSPAAEALRASSRPHREIAVELLRAAEAGKAWAHGLATNLAAEALAEAARLTEAARKVLVAPESLRVRAALELADTMLAGGSWGTGSAARRA